MDIVSTRKLERLLSEYQSFRAANELHGAALSLAHADYFLGQLREPERAAFEKRLNNIDFTAEERAKILEKVNTDSKKLRRMFYATETLVVEEIYLIVSLRIDLSLICEFMKRRWHMNVDIGLNEIDDEIRELRSTSKMKTLFNNVVRSVYENCGVLLRGTSVDQLPH